jgi:hypothetical protein
VDFVARVKEAFAEAPADKAGTASDEYFAHGCEIGDWRYLTANYANLRE